MSIRTSRSRYQGAALALAAAAAVAAGTMAGTAPALASAPAASLLGWGANNGGQLGNGTTTAAASPVRVSLPAGVSVSSVAAGANHALAVTTTGSLLAWGTNSLGQLGTNSRTSTTTPVTVQLPSGAAAAQAAAGNGFSLAVTSGGQVYAWGGNGSGQLGDGTSTTRQVPVPVNVAGNSVAEVSAGTAFSLALTTSHKVFAWGGNRDGELGNLSGNGSATPIPVTFPVPSGIVPIDVEAGGNFALALMSSGQVYAWGDGAAGQLGDNSTANSTPVLVQLTGGAVDAIAAGGDTGYALTDAHALGLAWGDGTAGQLGDGTDTSSPVPVQVSTVPVTTLTHIAAGTTSAVAYDTQGSAIAWGTGPLGAGSGVTTSDTPVTVALPSGQQPADLSPGPDAAFAFAGTQPAGTAAPISLSCTVGVADLRAGGTHTGVCSPRTASTSYTVDASIPFASEIGPVAWVVPSGATITTGCTSSDIVCDLSVTPTTSVQSFTFSAVADDANGSSATLSVVATIPAVCGSVFC